MTPDFDVCWNGSHKHVYLCIREPEPPQLRVTRIVCPVMAEYQNHEDLKMRVLALLRSRSTWHVKELRLQIGTTPQIISGILHRAKQAGLVKSIGYGQVQHLSRAKR